MIWRDNAGLYRSILMSRFKLASFNACVFAGFAKIVAAVEIIDGKA